MAVHVLCVLMALSYIEYRTPRIVNIIHTKSVFAMANLYPNFNRSSQAKKEDNNNFYTQTMHWFWNKQTR